MKTGLLMRFTGLSVMLALVMAGMVEAQWTRVAPNVYLTTSTDKVGFGLSAPTDIVDIKNTGNSQSGRLDHQRSDYNR